MDTHRSGAEPYHIDYALECLDKKGLRTPDNRITIISSRGNPYDVAEALIIMTENGLLEGAVCRD
jgi:hypothetical protein